MKLTASFLSLLVTCVAAAACGGSDDDTTPPGTSAGAAGAGGGSAGSAGATAGSAGKAQGGSGGAAAGSGGATGGSGGATGGSGGAAAGSGGAAAGSGGAAAGSGGAAAGAGGSTGGVDTPTCAAATGALPKLKLTPVISQGLGNPVLVTHAPGDATRLYVVQQNGLVRVAQNGKLTGVFADFGPKLVSGGERGLLGFAFHPQFSQNGRVFVHYSSKASANPGTKDGDTVIAEISATPDAGDVSTLKPLMTVTQPESNHNGGSIEFSPTDGFLYIALGDGGGGGDPHGPIGNGQKLDTMLGKLLRVDVSTVGKLAVPPSNPKLAGANPEIWSYGLRNPYRISFDMCTGDRYVADVGQNQHEEIDFEAAASPGGLNYGWRIMEGNACYNPQPCDKTGLTLPVTTYDHVQGNCSVTGGYVYRGAAIPGARGRYFYGDYCSGRIWSFLMAGGAATDVIEHTTELKSAGINVSGFGQDANGELYVVAYGGTVYRIDP